MMARYNRWQNRSIFDAAGDLDDAARRLDRNAFFRSIHGTLSHLLWGDTIWMSRFDGGEAPEADLGASAVWIESWDDLCTRRSATDQRILDWAGRISGERLNGELTLNSQAIGRKVTKPMALCVAHFFNHQTHHRGQVHAMLTAAGAKPGATDLFIMPDGG